MPGPDAEKSLSLSLTVSGNLAAGLDRRITINGTEAKVGSPYNTKTEPRVTQLSESEVADIRKLVLELHEQNPEPNYLNTGPHADSPVQSLQVHSPVEFTTIVSLFPTRPVPTQFYTLASRLKQTVKTP